MPTVILIQLIQLPEVKVGIAPRGDSTADTMQGLDNT